MDLYTLLKPLCSLNMGFANKLVTLSQLEFFNQSVKLL